MVLNLSVWPEKRWHKEEDIEKLLITDGILIIYIKHRIPDLNLTQEIAGITLYFIDKLLQGVSDRP